MTKKKQKKYAKIAIVVALALQLTADGLFAYQLNSVQTELTGTEHVVRECWSILGQIIQFGPSDNSTPGASQ